MNLSLWIAGRYLFAKKQTNAINIISAISIFGIAVGTAALILVLSVFNGFEDLITSMYNSFNPDVKVLPVQGKTFKVDSILLKKLNSIEGVEYVSQVLEEIAFFEYKENQDFGTLKGVDQNFSKVTDIDSTVREGTYTIGNGNKNTAVLGLGMRNKLSVDVDDPLTPLSVHMPKKHRAGIMDQPFNTRLLYPVGTFILQQDLNNKYVLTSLSFARELLDVEEEVSSLELKLYPGFQLPQVEAEINEIMGPGFEVKNRYRQEESFIKLMQVEKWLSYAIVGLMMLMISFNMVGVLWMMVLEKKNDIAVLRSMGANNLTTGRIFLYEGLLLCGLGLLLGFVIALLIYFAQKQFDLVKVQGHFIIDAYPASLRVFDFFVVTITVFAIGYLASLPPFFRAQRIEAFLREE